MPKSPLLAYSALSAGDLDPFNSGLNDNGPPPDYRVAARRSQRLALVYLALAAFWTPSSAAFWACLTLSCVTFWAFSKKL